MVRYVWTEEETEVFLTLIRDKNITAILDSKQQRNAGCYKELEREMRAKGFDKLWHILRSKWTTLKQRYLAEKRMLCKSGAGGKAKIKFKFYDSMDSILGHRPIVQAMSSVINSIDAEADDGEPIRETSMNSEASFDVLPILPHASDETPDVPEEEESSQAQPPSTPQEAWRRPKKCRTLTSSVHVSMIREQAKQDQATLTTISDVLKQAVHCFQRATEAAERHARALEVMSGAWLPIPQQPPPAHNPQQSFMHHNQPTTSYQPPPTSYHHYQQQPPSPNHSHSYKTYHSL
ncbi:hypothetical protein ABVT39_021136 [Epinephelus coioides]